MPGAPEHTSSEEVADDVVVSMPPPGARAARPHRVRQGQRLKKKRTFCSLLRAYLSCLLPNEAERTRVRNLDRGRLMSLLMLEAWTDGSLIALKVDIFAGVTLAVAQIAPCIAFALMAKAQPLVGLFSSFWLGIICCIFGGRPGQITAIAGAVVVLYPDLVETHGYPAACAVSIIAGCFILVPGFLRLARLVRLLPSSLMVGFCNGLGLSMVINQIPSFRDASGNYPRGLQALYTAIICVVSYCIMMLMPYFTNVVPSAFVAVVVGTAIQYIFQLHTTTIGDLYQLHGTFPKPMVPDIKWADSSTISDVMVASVLTAIISCVESFMSDYKMQQLTETPTNFEREALALGAAHIVNGFFQGTAGCVVYGPCILNIECGAGTRRLSGLICAVLMAIIPLALFAVIRIVPMAALSAVLFGVSSKTADWRMLAMIFLQRISFQESVVAILVTVVTVLSDLAIGAAAGLAAALVFFMWNMSRGRVNMAPMHHIVPLYTPGPAAANAVPAETGNGRPQDADEDDAAPLPAPLQREEKEEDRASAATTGQMPLSKDIAASHSVGAAAAAAATPLPQNQPKQRQSSTTSDEVASALPLPGRSASGSPQLNASKSANDDDEELSVSDINAKGGVFHASERRDRPQRYGSGASDGHNPTGNEYSDLEDAAFDVRADTAAAAAASAPPSSRMDVSTADVPRNTSLMGTPYALNVDFLAVKTDPVFPEIKMLRVQMSGILFFGSCMEFVDGFTKMLHEHHGEIFLKVTDMILDFGHGMMTVMDFSAAEALQDAAHILAKRNIRTHLVNLDPMSSVCFDRCRRYFPDVSDNNVDNQKHRCYVRRLFSVGETTVRALDPATGGDLADDVFLRPNRSFATRHAPESAAAAAADTEGSPPPLSSEEVQLPLEATLEVGFPVFRPAQGITVTVFATVPAWRERVAAEIRDDGICCLDLGLHQRKPFNRQFGDFFTRVWLQRLWKHDLKVAAAAAQREAECNQLGDPDAVAAAAEPDTHCFRSAPTEFEQVPRFPGQGYSKGERLSRREWAAIKSSIHRVLFHSEPPTEDNRVVARAKKFQRDLLDGFI